MSEREILIWELFGSASRQLAQAIADDVADTGHTLRSVQQFCAGKVGEVRTAVIYEKSRSLVKCDGRPTDEAVIGQRPFSPRAPSHEEPCSHSDLSRSKRIKPTTEPSYRS